MKLEQQVTSLELSKKLKELGVKQESLFYWTRNYTWKSGDFKADSKEYIGYSKNKKHYSEYEYAAFTVAELGELLPNLTTSWKQIETSDGDIGWRCHYDDKEVKTTIADTEAESRGKMLVYLLENNLINLSEVTK